MKKMKLSILTITIALSLTGCTGVQSPAAETVSPQAGEETASCPEQETETPEMISKEELTVPSYLTGVETDRFLRKEEGGDSITYQLTRQQRTETAEQIAAQLRDSMEQILADKEYYPNITDISADKDCSRFDVTFSGSELNIYETTLRMSLYIMGDKIQLYRGEPETELLTVVNYINGPTGEIISTGDSSCLK